MVLQTLLGPSRYSMTRMSDPFAIMERALQRAVGDTWSGGGVSSMAVKLDVKEGEKAYSVTAELPGLKESEVNVTFDDGVLTTAGEKKVERDEKKETWHITERSYGNFQRQISLPENVQQDKIEASFDKGVLTVTLPKQAEPEKKTRKIEIKNAG